MLKTMVLENEIEKALIFEQAGVTRIFVDLEINGKMERQGHLDTVISDHSVSDIYKLSGALCHSDILARVNPMFEGSRKEINDVINAGAKIVMLPMFKTRDEVDRFVDIVDGRAKTNLLLETTQAFCRIEDILLVKGINEIHVGLNDLHLAMKLNFMFELFCGKLMEELVQKFKHYKIDFGIGGVAQLNEGTLPGKNIITEHARLGSTGVILSRAFKNMIGTGDSLKDQLDELRIHYEMAINYSDEKLRENKIELEEKVMTIVYG